MSMNVTEFQQWVKDYYEGRGWSELDIFIRIGFLAEETGEVTGYKGMNNLLANTNSYILEQMYCD